MPLSTYRQTFSSEARQRQRQRFSPVPAVASAAAGSYIGSLCSSCSALRWSESRDHPPWSRWCLHHHSAQLLSYIPATTTSCAQLLEWQDIIHDKESQPPALEQTVPASSLLPAVALHLCPQVQLLDCSTRSGHKISKPVYWVCILSSTGNDLQTFRNREE